VTRTRIVGIAVFCVILIGAAVGIGVGLFPAGRTLDAATLHDALPFPRPKVVVIGIDGADWNVIRPLIDRGRLPALASLVREGATGDLESIPPMNSPALWTTVATGVGRERHGIRDFVYKTPGSYSQPVVNSTIRERLALWNILSELGYKVGVLNWYASWPAEEVNGFVISDRLGTLGPETEAGTYPPWERLANVLSPDKLPPPEPFAISPDCGRRSPRTSTSIVSGSGSTTCTAPTSSRSTSRASTRSVISSGATTSPTPRFMGRWGKKAFDSSGHWSPSTTSSPTG
jgi:hypothetical protein